MDKALQLVIQMNEWIWNRFRDDLKDATPEEIDWRPLGINGGSTAATYYYRRVSLDHLGAGWRIAREIKTRV